LLPLIAITFPAGGSIVIAPGPDVNDHDHPTLPYVPHRDGPTPKN
jgi:hypothetical protein